MSKNKENIVELDPSKAWIRNIGIGSAKKLARRFNRDEVINNFVAPVRRPTTPPILASVIDLTVDQPPIGESLIRSEQKPFNEAKLCANESLQFKRYAEGGYTKEWVSGHEINTVIRQMLIDGDLPMEHNTSDNHCDLVAQKLQLLTPPTGWNRITRTPLLNRINVQTWQRRRDLAAGADAKHRRVRTDEVRPECANNVVVDDTMASLSIGSDTFLTANSTVIDSGNSMSCDKDDTIIGNPPVLKDITSRTISRNGKIATAKKMIVYDNDCDSGKPHSGTKSNDVGRPKQHPLYEDSLTDPGDSTVVSVTCLQMENAAAELRKIQTPSESFIHFRPFC